MLTINKADTVIWFTDTAQAIRAKAILQQITTAIRTQVVNNTLTLSSDLSEHHYKEFYKLLNTEQPAPTKTQKLKEIVRTFGTIATAQDFAWAVRDSLRVGVSYLGRNVFLERILTGSEERIVQRCMAKAI